MKQSATPRSLASGLLALVLGSTLATVARAAPDTSKNWDKRAGVAKAA